ncbi:MAG: type II toxin-antitoxin system VapC family toxin [Deltaproteobacteria bacterium]|nr:type II toxin-antitoxin system VapC family toxin [Deltaproteobacteria bacterium]
MRLLLDTHVLLWWITDSRRLSTTARRLIADGDNALLWSAASAWETAIKHALGRLQLPDAPAAYLPKHLARSGIQSWPVTQEHAFAAGALPAHHSDPFDRLLIAQARIDELELVTADPMLARYDVNIRW